MRERTSTDLTQEAGDTVQRNLTYIITNVSGVSRQKIKRGVRTICKDWNTEENEVELVAQDFED